MHRACMECAEWKCDEPHISSGVHRLARRDSDFFDRQRSMQWHVFDMCAGTGGASCARMKCGALCFDYTGHEIVLDAIW